MTDLCTSGGSIEELRKVIDATDTELFGLLEKRAKLARSIGKLKAAGAVYKPERERSVSSARVEMQYAELLCNVGANRAFARSGRPVDSYYI